MSVDGTPQQRALPLDSSLQSSRPKETKGMAKARAVAEAKFARRAKAKALRAEMLGEKILKVAPEHETKGMAKARKKVEARIEAREQVQETQMKLCKKCNQLLSVEMFSPNGGHADGFHSRCKPCVQTMFLNKSLQAQIYYQVNFDLISARHQKYRRENPEVGIALKHLRRTRMQGNGGSFTAQDIRDMRSAQNHQCAYCQRAAKLTIDHIFPVSKGGSSDISNICLACRKCNSSKGAKLLEEWVNRWYERNC